MTALPKPGDWGVTPGGGWPMKMVRAWTGHPPFLRPAWAGHAAVVEGVDTDGTVHLIEATPDAGVRRRVVAAADPDWRWSNEALLDGQRTAIVNGAREELGKPYDWPSVMEVGVRVLFARFRGRAADHPDDRLFCSELVAWLYRDRGHHDLFPGLAPGTVSPDALDRRRAGPLTLTGGPPA
jgi:uncharacterized protein YycO